LPFRSALLATVDFTASIIFHSPSGKVFLPHNHHNFFIYIKSRFFRVIRACYQLKNFEARMAIFENRIAEYIDVFEKRKRKKWLFTAQKTRTDDTP
jgi:hypothetical protein